MTNINLPEGNRTRELLHCSAVPQLTAPAMQNLPDRIYISREADTNQLEDFNIPLHRCQKLTFRKISVPCLARTPTPVLCHTDKNVSPLPGVNTNTSPLSHRQECQSSASHGRISSLNHVTTSVRARSYTNRNKYHHLWYRNVIIQTSLSNERKANERKQARSELTSCDVNSAVPFSATLNTAQNEIEAARNMLTFWRRNYFFF